MKGTIVVAALSGFVAGVIGSALVPTREVAAPSADVEVVAAALGRELSKSLGDVRREIAELRRVSVAARRDAAQSAAPSESRPAEDLNTEPPPAEAPRRPRRSQPAPEETESPSENPPPNVAHLRELSSWSEKPEFRRHWMFADERTALSWFGAPDEVGTTDGVEIWSYSVDVGDTDGDGERDFEGFSLRFSRGRLIGP